MSDLEKLKLLAEKKKSQVMTEFKRKGYFENMGMKQMRDVEDAAMKIAHGSGNWAERQTAGKIVTNFDNWLASL